jgi:fatty-acyl-CoA synthase
LGLVQYPVVKSETDLQRIEALGFDAFLPYRSPYAILRAQAQATPDKIAIRFLRVDGKPEHDAVFTFAELLQCVERTARLFRRLGVGPEDSVAILVPHTPYGQIALWAASIAGRAAPLNASLRPEHLAALLRASNAKGAVVLGENSEVAIWPNVIKALRSEPSIKFVFDVDGDGPSAGSDGSLEELIAREPDGEPLPEPGPHAVAAYFHTGGTTGAPKLAVHTHQNQAFVARSAALMYALSSDDVLVNGFPLFHVAGSFVYGLSVLSAGGTLLIPGRLGMRNRSFVSSIWRRVAEYGVTAIGGVPTVISALNEVPVDADISTLRVMLTGGSPLPTELADAFERNVGKPVRNILGMTECAGVVTIEPFHGPRTAGSTGLRLPFTTVRAFPLGTDGIQIQNACSSGQTGIIALSGPNVAPGYSDPALNAGTFEAGGWLVSGDLGYTDAEGRIFVTGRAKDVIIRGAHNIDPGLIEDALLQHPAVLSAAAVGQPDAYAGELPVAFVSLKQGANVREAELLTFVQPLMSEPAACPKRIWILPELPLTPIRKIFKPTLREIALKAAITDAIAASAIAQEHVDLAVERGKATLTVYGSAPTGTADQIRKALLGMPISYDIRETGK